MKKMLALAVAAAGLAVLLAMSTQTANGGTAATTPSCTPGKPHPAFMTVKRLHMWHQLIGHSQGDLMKGPIWDPDSDSQARPGQGKPMVIYGHDMTPVPGYHGHGPFHDLSFMKRGDLVTITRCGVAYTYRYIRNYHPWQCSTERASKSWRRYVDGPGALICSPNNRANNAILHWPGENLVLRCCWPRKTMWQYFEVRLALISTRPSS